MWDLQALKTVFYFMTDPLTGVRDSLRLAMIGFIPPIMLTVIEQFVGYRGQNC